MDLRAIIIPGSPHTSHGGFVLTVTMAILSIFGAIGILASYVICVRERNMLRQILVALTLADGIICVSNLIGSIENKLLYQTSNNVTITSSNKTANCPSKVWCVAQSYITTTSCLVSYFYNMTIAIYIYIVTTKSYKTVLRIRLLWIHAVCLCIPLVIVTAAVTQNALGQNNYMSTGPWCWITNCISIRSQIVWMVVTAQGWEMLNYLLAPLLFYFGFYEIYKQRRAKENPFARVNAKLEQNARFAFREEDKNYCFIPPLFYFLRVWGTVRFIIAVTELSRGSSIGISDTWRTFLYFMQCILDNSQAFTNFILFCLFDKTIRQKMWQICCNGRRSEENRPILSTRSSLQNSLLLCS